jgi:hypothetical protein
LHTASADGYRLKSLIEAVAMSDVFRMNVATSAAAPGVRPEMGGQ